MFLHIFFKNLLQLKDVLSETQVPSDEEEGSLKKEVVALSENLEDMKSKIKILNAGGGHGKFEELITMAERAEECILTIKEVRTIFYIYLFTISLSFF